MTLAERKGGWMDFDEATDGYIAALESMIKKLCLEYAVEVNCLNYSKLQKKNLTEGYEDGIRDGMIAATDTIIQFYSLTPREERAETVCQQ